MGVSQGFDTGEGLPTFGSWSVQFKPETPQEIRKAAFGSHEIYEFGWSWDHIAITPTRLRDPGLTRSTLLSRSIYTGMIEDATFGRFTEPWSVSGASPMAWLGQPSSPPIGPMGFGPYTINNDFATIMVAMFSTAVDVGGLTLYSAATCSGNTISDDTVDYEVALETVKRYMRHTTTRTEMWVRPDLGVHFAEQGNSAIFAQTPTVLMTSTKVDPAIGGDLFVIPGSTFTKTRSVRDHAFGVTIKASGGSITTYENNPDPRYAADGTSEYESRAYYESTSADVGAEGASLHSDRHRTTSGAFELAVKCDVPAVLSHLKPGDWVYIHDPDTYTVDTGNEVVVGGRLMYPVALRVAEVSMPIGPGMGVYRLANSSADPSANAVQDLSDWFVPEAGQTTIRFDTAGMPLRRLLKNFPQQNNTTSSW